MLVVMKAHAGPADIKRVYERIEALGFNAHIIPGEQRTQIDVATPVDPPERDLPTFAAIADSSRGQSPQSPAPRVVELTMPTWP